MAYKNKFHQMMQSSLLLQIQAYKQGNQRYDHKLSIHSYMLGSSNLFHQDNIHSGMMCIMLNFSCKFCRMKSMVSNLLFGLHYSQQGNILNCTGYTENQYCNLNIIEDTASRIQLQHRNLLSMSYKIDLKYKLHNFQNKENTDYLCPNKIQINILHKIVSLDKHHNQMGKSYNCYFVNNTQCCIMYKYLYRLYHSLCNFIHYMLYSFHYQPNKFHKGNQDILKSLCNLDNIMDKANKIHFHLADKNQFYKINSLRGYYCIDHTLNHMVYISHNSQSSHLSIINKKISSNKHRNLPSIANKLKQLEIKMSQECIGSILLNYMTYILIEGIESKHLQFDCNNTLESIGNNKQSYISNNFEYNQYINQHGKDKNQESIRGIQLCFHFAHIVRNSVQHMHNQCRHYQLN